MNLTNKQLITIPNLYILIIFELTMAANRIVSSADRRLLTNGEIAINIKNNSTLDTADDFILRIFRHWMNSRKSLVKICQQFRPFRSFTNLRMFVTWVLYYFYDSQATVECDERNTSIRVEVLFISETIHVYFLISPQSWTTKSIWFWKLCVFSEKIVAKTVFYLFYILIRTSSAITFTPTSNCYTTRN